MFKKNIGVKTGLATVGVVKVAKKVVTGGSLVMTAVIMAGIIGSAPKTVNRATENTAGLVETFASITNDPSVENIKAAQADVDRIINSFEVPEWVERIANNPNIPEMTEDDTILGYMFANSLPESIQKYFNNGNVFDAEKVDVFENSEFDLTEEDLTKVN